MKNEVMIRLEENSKIDKVQTQAIAKQFTGFFEEASNWEKEIENIQITSIEQVDDMKKARAGRLALKNIRVNADKVRAKLKEKSLKEGQFIQSIYNTIKGIVEPLEKDLLEKEKFVERIEEARLDELERGRIADVEMYDVDLEFVNVRMMTDEAYINFQQSAKQGYEMRIAAEKKAENDRMAKEKAERIEQERIRNDNKRLELEAEKRQKEIDKINTSRKEEEEKSRLALERSEAEKKAILDKARKEEEERNRIESEKRQKEIDEQKRIEAEELEKAQLPEKQKLIEFANLIKSLEPPVITDMELKGHLSRTMELLNGASSYLFENC